MAANQTSPGNTPAGNTWKQNPVFTKSWHLLKLGIQRKSIQENSSWAWGRAQASSRENVRIQTKVLRPCLEIKEVETNIGWCSEAEAWSPHLWEQKSPQGLLLVWRDHYSQQGEMDQVFYGVTSITWFTRSTTLPSCHHFCSQPNLWERTVGVRHDGHHVPWRRSQHHTHVIVQGVTMPSKPASSSFLLVPTEAPHSHSRGLGNCLQKQVLKGLALSLQARNTKGH